MRLRNTWKWRKNILRIALNVTGINTESVNRWIIMWDILYHSYRWWNWYNRICDYIETLFMRRFNLNIHEYIDQRLDAQIKWYSEKSSHAQKMYKRSQIIEIVLASSIPLLSGYTSNRIYISIIIGVFGAIIAIIESLSKLYKWHENWIQYRTTSELLKYHKHLYLTQSPPYTTGDATIENIFIKNIEDIISSENNQWKANATSDSSKKSSN